MKNVVSPGADMPEGFWAFFEDRCTQKATALGILAPQQQVATIAAVPLTGTVQKGGSSGIPLGATWGDKFKQQQYGAQFPGLGSKG